MNITTTTFYKGFATLKSAENYIAKLEMKYNVQGLTIESQGKGEYIRYVVVAA